MTTIATDGKVMVSYAFTTMDILVINTHSRIYLEPRREVL